MRNTARMLVHKDLKSGETRNFFMVFIGTYDYLKRSNNIKKNSYLKRDENFEGDVMFYNLDGSLINGWRYRNKKIVARITPSKKTTLSPLKKTMSSSGGGYMDCYTDYNTIEWQDCWQESEVGWDDEFGMVAEVTLVCETHEDREYFEVCNWIDDYDDYPDYPPTDPGHVDPPPSNPNNDNKLRVIPSKDPCAGRFSVNERLNKNSVKTQNQLALQNTRNLPVNGKNVEYGYETKFSSLTDKTFVNNTIKSGTSSSLPLNTFWNSSHGYYVGYTHTHPGNNAPSPSDLFHGSQWYYTVPASERDVYTGYYTSTIVTDNYVYVVTIKNETKWAAKDFSDVNYRKKEDESYLKMADKFMRKTGDDNTIQAAEYALLKLYGNAVNIYRSSNSATLNFSPLKLQSRKPAINPCL